MTKVSIIVPIYGVEKYIECCAVSLFEQTYEDIEYIFVNDATPDKSMEVLAEVVKRYPRRAKQVKIITHTQNKGLSAARNSGLAACNSEYIWHVDSDDYIAADAVEKLINTAEKQNADIVVFDVNVVSTNRIKIERVNYNSKTNYIRRLLQHTEKCAHWNKFYRKSLIDLTGIRSDENIRLAEDYAVTPRLLYLAEKVVILHEPLYYYETRNQNSYVHNLSKTAIVSQHRADAILTAFFTDKPEYQNIISVLPQRSMISLIKNSNRNGWPVVTEIYKEALSHSGKGLTLVNRIIFNLAKHHKWGQLKLFMVIYHLIMRDRI